MQEGLKAVIFDMDGVLIDSEPLWRKAMIRAFTEAGMPFTEEDCRKTMGMRIGEVVRYWLGQYPAISVAADVLEQRIVSYLLELIEREGRLVEGVDGLLDFCREKGIRTGLATSSSNLLMNAILKKLDLEDRLEVVVSAEHLPYGKPHPEVFLVCAGQLRVAPQHCLVIEDSLNGVIAARAAQMSVVAVPEEFHRHDPKFIIADHTRDNMGTVLALFKSLFA